MTATFLIRDLISDAWRQHGELNGWVVQCGAAVYADLQASRRPTARDPRRVHLGERFNFGAGRLFIVESADLPPNHVVLRNPDGVVVAGAHMVTPDDPPAAASVPRSRTHGKDPR